MALDRKTRILGTAILVVGVCAIVLQHADGSDEAMYRNMVRSSHMSRKVRWLDRRLGTGLSDYFSRRAESTKTELYARGFLSSHKLVFPGGTPSDTQLYTNMSAACGEDVWCTIGFPNRTSVVVFARTSYGPALAKMAAGLGSTLEAEGPVEPANRRQPPRE